ncbi:sensor histidine kinase [Methylocystis bryophila]|uniref:histidine kinase n=1 Tax=Methylocystis bryophila TaxID=655015 RepID=A0A1W6MU54_9HYPH|nr:HAMP domain-containing sensor histidine kinase [Methylocystis bryophila]ARN81134.1 two-component sensor histidine kinase [Methylocystis bryophila]BDV37063.1 two-component sensor histidine kinase [Methylocystis bryophila]
MPRGLSLARRVVFYLVLAQLFAFLVGALVTAGLNFLQVAYFGWSLDELAFDRTSALVSASLVRGDDSELRVLPNEELRRETSRAPRLQFAVFARDRKPLQGSSPELAELLAKAGLISISSIHSHFVLPGDDQMTPLGHLELVRTPFGRLQIATYRQKFRWDDIVFGFIADEFKWNIAYLFSVIVISTGTAWFAVRRGLEPLRATARQMETLDFDSLSDGVVAADAPSEIQPFVEAINALLARLDASARRMRRYTANAAHELRTPLAILRARLQNPLEPGFRREMERDASQLQAIVDQILIEARLCEKQVCANEDIDLNELAWSVVAGRTPLAIKCGRNLEFEGAPTKAQAKGNRRAIESVLANIIDNALRAEPEGGTILTRVTMGPVVEVVDHGEGVAAADREIIFEPFWRKSEASSGAGLGLAIAKELMERLGGRVWVEETPGGGATFKLRFAQE